MRFGLKGVAVNLVTSSEAKLLDGIRRYYACTIDPLSVQSCPSSTRIRIRVKLRT